MAYFLWLPSRFRVLRRPAVRWLGWPFPPWPGSTHGDLAIDNNASERALRRVVTGRNNWLFCGSDEGGMRAAILYSLVATCREHAIHVWEYLKDVLERIPTHPDRRRAELLPRNWKSARAQAQA